MGGFVDPSIRKADAQKRSVHRERVRLARRKRHVWRWRCRMRELEDRWLDCLNPSRLLVPSGNKHPRYSRKARPNCATWCDLGLMILFGREPRLPLCGIAFQNLKGQDIFRADFDWATSL